MDDDDDDEEDRSIGDCINELVVGVTTFYFFLCTIDTDTIVFGWFHKKRQAVVGTTNHPTFFQVSCTTVGCLLACGST
jgi:hypothetical protein